MSQSSLLRGSENSLSKTPSKNAEQNTLKKQSNLNKNNLDSKKSFIKAKLDKVLKRDFFKFEEGSLKAKVGFKIVKGFSNKSRISGLKIKNTLSNFGASLGGKKASYCFKKTISLQGKNKTGLFKNDRISIGDKLKITSGLVGATGLILNNAGGFDKARLIFSRAGRNKNAIISQIQEKELAKILDGRVHWFSGATFYEKSDLSSELFRIEAKTTFKKDKIIIKTSDVLKIESESLLDDRMAMLSFKLDGLHYGIVKKDNIDSLLTFIDAELILLATIKPKIARKQITIQKDDLTLINSLDQCYKEARYIPVFFNGVEYCILFIDFFVYIQKLYKEKVSLKNGIS